MGQSLESNVDIKINVDIGELDKLTNKMNYINETIDNISDSGKTNKEELSNLIKVVDDSLDIYKNLGIENDKVKGILEDNLNTVINMFNAYNDAMNGTDYGIADSFKEAFGNISFDKVSEDVDKLNDSLNNVASTSENIKDSIVDVENSTNNINISVDTSDVDTLKNKMSDLNSTIADIWEAEQLLDQQSFDNIILNINELISQYSKLGSSSDEFTSILMESVGMINDIFDDSINEMGLMENTLDSMNNSLKSLSNDIMSSSESVTESVENIANSTTNIKLDTVKEDANKVNENFIAIENTLNSIGDTIDNKLNDKLSLSKTDIDRIEGRLTQVSDDVDYNLNKDLINDTEYEKLYDIFSEIIGKFKELRSEFELFSNVEKVSEEEVINLAGAYRELDKTIGENGGVMSELLKNSSFKITDEEVRALEEENNARKSLINSLAEEYDKQVEAENAKRLSIETANELMNCYTNLQGAIDSFNTSNGTLGSFSSSMEQFSDSSNTATENTENVSKSLNDVEDKTKSISNEVSNGIDKSVTGIITTINQGLDIIEKVYDTVADISGIAEEINQTIFEMSTLIGGEVTEEVIEYTNAMQELYGLDGTTMLNQMSAIERAVTKMGLSVNDSLSVSTELGRFAQDLGAVTGDFDRAFSDIASIIDKGFVGRTSTLYYTLSKDEINELKSLNTEVERFNYLISKSTRLDGTFENFLETSNGKIYLLRQSFESLKSNVAAFATTAYAAVAPVLTRIINGLNSILSKLIDIFNIEYKALDYEGVANDFSESANKIKESAEEAQKSLLSFDDIISLDKDSNNSNGLGDLLNTDKLDTGKINETIEETKSRLDELVENFRTGWNNAWDIGNADKAISDIEKNIDNVKKSLSEIWNDPSVQSAIENFENQSAKTLGAISGAATVTGLNIAAGLSGGTAKWLEEDSEHIKDKIIDLADASTKLSQEVEQAAYNFADFSTVFNDKGFINLTASLERLGFDIQTEAQIIGTNIATAIAIGFNSIWETSGEAIKSAVDTTFGAIGDLINGVDTIVVGLGKDIEDLFTNKLFPFAEQAGNVIGEYIITPLCNSWENDIAPIFSELGSKLDELWNEHLQPLWEKIQPFVDYILDRMLLEIEVIGMIANIIINTLGPVIGGLISYTLEWLINVIEDIIDLVGGLADVMVGIFTGDKDKIINGLKDIGKAVLNALIDTINLGIGTVINSINGMIGGINTIISYAGGEGITPLNKSDFQIPRLATGGIVTRSILANVGEDGREAVLPLQNNTEWMDTLADRISNGIANRISSMINSNNNNPTINIDMSKANKEFYTRSEYIAGCQFIVNSLRTGGYKVQLN